MTKEEQQAAIEQADDFNRPIAIEDLRESWRSGYKQGTAEIDRLKKELFTMEEIERAWQEAAKEWRVSISALSLKKGLVANLKKQKEGQA